MIGVILVSLSLLAIVRYSHSRMQSLYFKSLLSVALPGDFMDEDKVLSHRASLILLLNCAVFVSLLISVMSEIYIPELFEKMNFAVFLLIFLSLVTLFVVKVLVQTSLRTIFEDEYGVKEYILNNSFANMLLGIVLIPLVLCVLFMSKSFNPLFFQLCLLVIIAVQVFKLLKGTLIAIKYKVNLLYFILYLCCFELMPFLVLFKEVILND